VAERRDADLDFAVLEQPLKPVLHPRKGTGRLNNLSAPNHDPTPGLGCAGDVGVHLKWMQPGTTGARTAADSADEGNARTPVYAGPMKLWRHFRRPSRWRVALAGLVLFAVLGIILALTANGNSLRAHNAALLSLGLGVTVFAVNFSSLAFQMSPYRTLVRGASPRHLLAALVLTALALVPLGGFACGDRLVGQLAVGLIPLLAYGSFVLTMLAQREAEPLVLLERRLSPRALARFFPEFAESVRAELRRRGDDDRGERRIDEKAVPPPTHEIFYRMPPPPQVDDPLEFLVRLSNAAIANSDTHTYAAAVTRALAITREVGEQEEPDTDVPGYKVKGALEDHARSALERIGRAATEEKVPEEFAERFVIACGEYLEGAADARLQGKERTLRILKVGGDIAAELVRRGATGAAVGLLVVIRQVAERGMEEIPEGEFDRYHLVGYPDVVAELGKQAVKVGDTEFLYRCFDTLGWMGCAAVRWGAGDAGRLCMQALVQTWPRGARGGARMLLHPLCANSRRSRRRAARVDRDLGAARQGHPARLAVVTRNVLRASPWREGRPHARRVGRQAAGPAHPIRCSTHGNHR
jgi:hypothetical protein